ncbi:DUF3575 domain-containing protein [Pontibacter pudoricolor]|uniref:DUF3575 domain-containing protein n=1 Tax=Pontibacter pudoricolor TaxID=2694930 RepID=UPI00192EBE48|nr:DUF3575 domain-containing protein [Pontibacter pudoricolor]
MKHLFTTLLCCLSAGVCVAQNDPASSPILSVDSTTTIQTALPNSAPVATTPEVNEVFRKNGIKMNLSSLAFSNYSFSYERAIARKITLVGGYSFLPETKLSDIPLVDKGIKFADLDEEGEEGDEIGKILDEANFSSNAITGEVRFYTGKKPGARGFYASLYGRYTTMNLTHLYVYEGDAGLEYDLPINAKLTGFGGGVMLGAQWLIAKRVTFDWYIVGGHYGKMKGDFTAKTDLSTMPQEDKAELEREIEDVASNGDRKYLDATINDNGMFGKLNAPFGGLRGFGFNLGIAF